jgi:glycosyltransferase involved in cell wall biosynthesis
LQCTGAMLENINNRTESLCYTIDQTAMTYSTSELNEKIANETNTSPTFQAHLIDVTLNDLDFGLILQKGLCAVLPAFNDESVIGSVILKTKQYVNYVIVVDDGSTDRTAEVAKFAGAEVIRLEHSTGKAYAILLGLRRANEKGCAVTVVLDADGQHDPQEIQRVAGLVMAGKADLVIGSRFLEKSRNIPIRQQIKQGLLQLPSDVYQDLIPTDPLSGFVAFSLKSMEYLDFTFEKSRFYQNLIKHFLSKNLLIKEVSITEHSRILSKCKWDYSSTVIAAMPAYNEGAFIGKIIPEIKSYVDLVIVVDDGSTDATSLIAQQLGAYVIKHPENRGYGAALQTIFSAARVLNVDALVILDSDGQHNPNDIEKVLEPLLKGADVVIGSRFLDKTKNAIPKYRQIGMKVLDNATAAAGVKNGIDTQSGFRAYGKKAISIINISGTGMSAGSEILIQINDKNLSIVEVPINVRYDINDTSSQNPVKHGVLVFYNIIGMIGYKRPLPTFGIPGLILVITGFFFGSWAISEYYTTATFPFVLSMVSGVFVMMGLLLIIAALILNFLVVFVKEQKTTLLLQ